MSYRFEGINIAHIFENWLVIILFSLIVFVNFNVLVILASEKVGRFYLLFCFLKEFAWDWYYFFLKYLKEFTSDNIESKLSFVGKF